MKRFYTFFVWLFAAGLLISFAGYTEQVSSIAAKVNNEVITSKDIEDYCNMLSIRLSNEDNTYSCEDSEFKAKALSKLIEDRLILAEAKQIGIQVPPSAINERLQKMMLSFPSREEFEESLKEKGLTITSLKSVLKEKYLMQLIVEHYVKSFISISPQEISQFYSDNKKDFYAPLTYSLYISQAKEYIPMKELSMLIDEQGIEGVNKTYKNALVLVESSKNELRPEFVKIVETLNEGEKTIEKIDDFYFLVYFDKLNQPRLLSLNEVNENINSYLKTQKFKSRFSEWVSELKEKAVITTY